MKTDAAEQKDRGESRGTDETWGADTRGIEQFRLSLKQNFASSSDQKQAEGGEFTFV